MNDASVLREPVVVVVCDETDSLGELDRWTALVQAVLTTEGVHGPAEANVTFVDAEVMAELNREHMDTDGPTDVLSFPIDGADGPDGESAEGAVGFIGDLIVCPSVAAANAPEHAGNLDDELAVLLVHGTLHLIGHDHAEPDERDAMWDAERRLVAQHWRPLSTDPWARR